MNFLTRGAVLASGLFISQVIANPASAALVQYTFSGSGSTGTLILDGAVSANSGWGPLSGTSLVNYFEFNSTVYVPPNSNVTTASGLISNTGANLDGGNITLLIPPPPPQAWALAFTPTANLDSVTIGGGAAIMGNWSGGTAVAPIPAAVWLFCSGLLGLLGVTRLKKAT